MKARIQAVNRADSGFTLLELLTTIAIIAVLATLCTVAFTRATETAKATACSSNLRQLGVALNLYLADHDMIMPELRGMRSKASDDAPVIDNTLDKYLKDKRAFACPGDNLGLAAASGTSYYWNTALNHQPLGSLKFLNLTEDHSRIPILADKQGFHPYLEDKVNVLYADGHATKDLKFWQDGK